MSREVPHWVGKTDDTSVPPRVRLRIYDRYGGICQICFAKEKILGPVFDHKVALINGGLNCEANLVPVHYRCHQIKTRADVAEKAATYKTRAHHLVIRKARRPMRGSRDHPLQEKRKMDGTVVRRTQSTR
jgi:5-methylcytosine-specific restriction protein A